MINRTVNGVRSTDGVALSDCMSNFVKLRSLRRLGT